jgi:hypothetical protein
VIFEMTRISTFGLYECPKCGQIHIKPEYGSISIYVPTDLFVAPTAIKICQGCRWEGQLSDFKYLGLKSKVHTRNPSNIELIFRKILNKPYIEQDVRKIYPSL